MKVLVRSSSIKTGLEALSQWQLRPRTLERLLPGWMGMQVNRLPESIESGAELELATRGFAGARRRWRTCFEAVDPETGFREVLREGCLRSWTLERRFRAEGEGSSRCEEHLAYSGTLGRPGLESRFINALDWRHIRMRNDLARHGAGSSRPLRVLISGASGMVGCALATFLASGGHEVRRLVRRAARPGSGEFSWDPARGEIDHAAFEGVDAVVNLSGAGIADARWTSQRMQLLHDSRVDSTRLLAETLVATGCRAVMINASATGYYGDRPAGVVQDDDAPGQGFLPETCIAWEGAAESAREAGLRVVSLRIGVVIAFGGGILGKLRRPVLLGMAGPIGSGRQGMSWIAIDDLLGIVLQAIDDDRFTGPINAVAPEPVDNRRFMRTMGRVLRRPTVAVLPSFMARAIFGKMGEEALLQGAFVHPERLGQLGFGFDFPDLESALRFELGRTSMR